jgi:chaperonin cofactor prefoldin
MKIRKTPVQQKGQSVEDYLSDLSDFCIEAHGAFKGQVIQDEELLGDMVHFLMEFSSEPQYNIIRRKYEYDNNQIPEHSQFDTREKLLAEILRQRDLLDSHITKHKSLSEEGQTVKALSEVYYLYGKMTVNEIVEKLVKDGVLHQYADLENKREMLDSHQRRVYRYIQKYPSFAQMESFAYSKQKFKRI